MSIDGSHDLISCEIDDPVEERESEEVEGGAGSHGGSIELSSVEEEVSEDLSKDVFIEGEERERIHLRSCRVERCEIEERKGKGGVDDGSRSGRR